MESDVVHTVSWVQECYYCKGTGIYVGLSEHNGAAVVCNRCKGTGRQEKTYSYKDFTGRKIRDGVTRVFASSCGFVIEPGSITPGGVPYGDWQIDSEAVYRPDAELRVQTCPAQWQQEIGKPMPRWKECILPGQNFSECPSFKLKKKCWERWDAELIAYDRLRSDTS